MMKNTLKLVLVFALLTFVSPCQSKAVTCQVTPSLIEITMGYHGMPIEIKGESAPGDDVIVKVTSAPGDAHLKYKGKAAGIFWMKLGTLIFKNIPGTYLVSTSAPIDTALSPAERDQNAIGFDALKKVVEINAEHGDLPAGDWFKEFLEFKKKEKVYSLKEGDVQVSANGGYTLTLNWPFQAQPGVYTVEVITAKNGAITGKSESSVKVEMTGMVAKISDLASNQRALYGTLAILVALIVGFAVGNIFKKGGGAH
ncbi:MAG: TIGR02186 family protein [Desulfobulbaceae bacterium]|nr:TIGR02186 family protein [Desulfobulbaceae bacterium]